MESTAYPHRIHDIVPWNPLNFHGINGKNLWHFMNFHNFLLLVYLPSTAMETLKTPSEYSVDFNRRFQGFSMANLEKGSIRTHSCGVCLFGLILYVPSTIYVELDGYEIFTILTSFFLLMYPQTICPCKWIFCLNPLLHTEQTNGFSII